MHYQIHIGGNVEPQVDNTLAGDVAIRVKGNTRTRIELGSLDGAMDKESTHRKLRDQADAHQKQDDGPMPSPRMRGTGGRATGRHLE